jgi:hypothetical protein
LRKLYELAKLIPRGTRCLTEHMSGHLRERGRGLVEAQGNVNPLELIKVSILSDLNFYLFKKLTISII